MIAEKYGASEEQIVVGNGSNEMIDLLIRVFCQREESILTSKGAFIAYKICAKAAGVQVVETPLDENLGFDVDALIEKLESEKFNLVFVANPNNPTGSYLGHEDVTRLLEKTQAYPNTLVILDEAYNEFARAKDFPRGIEFLDKYKNLVVLNTLSKVYAVAGLRVGFIMAYPEVCDYINRVRNPFNVNSLAQAGAIAALKLSLIHISEPTRPY